MELKLFASANIIYHALVYEVSAQLRQHNPYLACTCHDGSARVQIHVMIYDEVASQVWRSCVCVSSTLNLSVAFSASASAGPMSTMHLLEDSAHLLIQSHTCHTHVRSVQLCLHVSYLPYCGDQPQYSCRASTAASP